MNSLVLLLAELNAALAGAVLAVLIVRRAFRTKLGPRAAYGLWLSVPAALIAVCLPRTTNVVDVSTIALPQQIAMAALVVWAAGAVLTAGLMLAAQVRFEAQARRGLAGPAVVGVIVGRLVMPADSDARWSLEERAAIRDHERAHLDRGDLRINAAAALLQCLFWFNPLAQLGMNRFRFDQELACDATVMCERPGRRRLYAEALLKSAPTPPPAFGCAWAPAEVRLLETRLTCLRLPRHTPDMGARLIVLAFVLATATLAWTLQPPSPERQRASPAPVLNLRLLPQASPTPLERS